MSTLTQNELEIQNTLKERLPLFSWETGSALYEQIVKPWAVNLADRDVAIDTLKESMSLVQVLNSDSPDEELVTKLLSNFNVTLQEGSVSSGYLAVYFKGANTVSIPNSAVFTCGGVQLRPNKTYIGVVGTITTQDSEVLAYIQAQSVGNSEYVFVIEVTTLDVNDTVIGPGQTCTSELSSSFITKVVTASTFSGGSLPETIESLLERAKLGITEASNTGKDNIRSLATNSPYNVIDSSVFGFGDATQTRDTHNNAGISTGGRADLYVCTDPVIQQVDILIQAERVVDTYWKFEIPSLYAGAYGVSNIFTSNYTITGPYAYELNYVPTNSRPYIDNAQEARYSSYQKLYVYFYDENTRETVETTKQYSTTVLYMPNIDELQSYMEDPLRQAATFDVLVKAFIPVEISVGLTLEYSQGVVPPDEALIVNKIAEAINSKLSGTAQLPASDIVYAAKQVFKDCTVLMPIRMQGTIYLPSGEVGYSSSTNNIEVPVHIEGVDKGNTKFFCNPADVSVTLKELNA
jgi:hypothetical protein